MYGIKIHTCTNSFIFRKDKLTYQAEHQIWCQYLWHFLILPSVYAGHHIRCEGWAFKKKKEKIKNADVILDISNIYYVLEKSYLKMQPSQHCGEFMWLFMSFSLFREVLPCQQEVSEIPHFCSGISLATQIWMQKSFYARSYLNIYLVLSHLKE